MIDVKLLSGALGAEISGIDLTDVSDKNFKKANASGSSLCSPCSFITQDDCQHTIWSPIFILFCT